MDCVLYTVRQRMTHLFGLKNSKKVDSAYAAAIIGGGVGTVIGLIVGILCF